MLNEGSTVTIGLVLILIAAALAAWRWVEGRFTIAAADADAKIEALRKERELSAEALHKRISDNAHEAADRLLRMEREHHEFQLAVTTHYASAEKLQHMQDQFTSAIDKLINRFDAFAVEFHRSMGERDSKTHRPTR